MSDESNTSPELPVDTILLQALLRWDETVTYAEAAQALDTVQAFFRKYENWSADILSMIMAEGADAQDKAVLLAAIATAVLIQNRRDGLKAAPAAAPRNEDASARSPQSEVPTDDDDASEDQS